MDISYHMDHMIHMDCYLDTSDGNMAYTRVDQHSAILYFQTTDIFVFCTVDEDNVHTPVCSIRADKLSSMTKTA